MSLKLLRGESTFSKTVERERLATLLEESHLKLLSMGTTVPLDLSEEVFRRIDLLTALSLLAIPTMRSCITPVLKF